MVSRAISRRRGIRLHRRADLRGQVRAQRDGWRLIREGEILHQAQSAFVPDFVFRHQDGTQVLMEIVGFWTPEYLADKRRTLQQFHQHHILIALPERSVRENATVGDNAVLYKTALKLQPVLAAWKGIVRPGERPRRPQQGHRVRRSHEGKREERRHAGYGYRENS